LNSIMTSHHVASWCPPTATIARWGNRLQPSLWKVWNYKILWMVVSQLPRCLPALHPPLHGLTRRQYRRFACGVGSSRRPHVASVILMPGGDGNTVGRPGDSHVSPATSWFGHACLCSAPDCGACRRCGRRSQTARSIYGAITMPCGRLAAQSRHDTRAE